MNTIITIDEKPPAVTVPMPRSSLRNGMVIRLSQEQVRKRVLSALPISGAFGPATYSVPSATVSLLASGRIHIDARVVTGVGGMGIDTSISVSSGIRYADGSFYLCDFAFGQSADASPGPGGEDSSGILGVIGRFASAARDGVAQAAEASVSYVLEKMPIYTLDGDDVLTSAARLSLRDVTVEDRTLVIRLNPLQALRHGKVRNILVLATAGLVAAAGGVLAAMHGLPIH